MQTQQQIISIISEYQYMDSGGTVFYSETRDKKQHIMD